MEIIIAVIVGLVFGGIIGWFLRPQNNRDFEITQLNKLLNQQKADIENLRGENRSLFAESSARRGEVQALQKVRESMLNDFRAISADLLDKQKDSVVGTQKTVLGPVTDEMKKLKDEFDKHIKDMLKNSSENKTSIDLQIKNMLEKSDKLQKEADNLANALKNKKTQGCWGETYLENVLQMLGFVEGTDYVKEDFYKSEDGSVRPDFILHLPGNKKIIIDSKVSMESYLNYENAENETTREKYADDFLRATQSHIDKLTAKDYQKKVKESGLDYVFMFMPMESAYILAMKKKPELYYTAQNKNIALITSSLLFPILKTVEMLLKIDKQNKNITEVMDMVNSLYEKYVGFTQNFAAIGKEIDGAKKAYDGALGQLSEGKGNMAGWFEKIKKKSGIGSTKTPAVTFKGDEDE